MPDDSVQNEQRLCLQSSKIVSPLMSFAYLVELMGLFAGLRKMREMERHQLPFLNSIIDFDIIIEIGYAQELGKPLTLKQLSLCSIGSLSTIRRKLSLLVKRDVVFRRKHLSDSRTTHLLIAPPALKMLTKYSGAISSISLSHFSKMAKSRV
jgi:hypothetical protein